LGALLGEARWLTSCRFVVFGWGHGASGGSPGAPSDRRRSAGPTQSAACGVAERTRLDFRRYVADTMRMGVSAAVVGFRSGLNRGTTAGESDEYLVARLRAGDDAAFEAIYDRYARGVLAFCAQMLGSREAAEDALQLTFVSAFRALRRGESNISLRPWLYTIARNRCLSELRTRRDVVGVDGVARDRPFLEGVADLVQRREDLRELLEDMQRLPADQRAALVLFELGDHSHAEIAVVLGVRREKVKALIFQARQALVRGREARESPCAEVRERLATVSGKIPWRGTTRAHIDR
jgi:RNA polymerase sigma factor (sigma-70 family)